MNDFWQSDENVSGQAEVTDMVFSILSGKRIPVDHADYLGNSISALMPWFEHEPNCGLQLLQSAASGNGWVSPVDDLKANPTSTGHDLLLSKRAKLTLRIPHHRVAAAKVLEGQTLILGGNPIVLGMSQVREIKPSQVLYAKYVLTESRDETEFLEWAYQQILSLGFQSKKLLCGKYNTLTYKEKKQVCVSLMLADLNDQDSLLIQSRGLGAGRTFGFGIFSPHKGLGV